MMLMTPLSLGLKLKRWLAWRIRPQVAAMRFGFKKVFTLSAGMSIDG
jgi:hypothetical protein